MMVLSAPTEVHARHVTKENFKLSKKQKHNVPTTQLLKSTTDFHALFMPLADLPKVLVLHPTPTSKHAAIAVAHARRNVRVVVVA